MTVIVMDSFLAPIEHIRPICSICVIVLWIKFFYFLRVFDATSNLIRMIISIVSEMKNFLLVLLNLLIAIMGDTFARVLDNITNITIREKVKLVRENDNLFDRKEIFKDA